MGRILCLRPVQDFIKNLKQWLIFRYFFINSCALSKLIFFEVIEMIVD